MHLKLEKRKVFKIDFSVFRKKYTFDQNHLATVDRREKNPLVLVIDVLNQVSQLINQ